MTRVRRPVRYERPDHDPGYRSSASATLESNETLTICRVPLSSSERQTPSTRAKDSDRNDICKVLDTAMAEGQLSMAEHRDRVSAATNATTLGALRELVSDLQ